MPEIRHAAINYRLMGLDGHYYAILDEEYLATPSSMTRRKRWWVVRVDSATGKALQENGTAFHTMKAANAEFDRLTGRHRSPVGT